MMQLDRSMMQLDSLVMQLDSLVMQLDSFTDGLNSDTETETTILDYLDPSTIIITVLKKIIETIAIFIKKLYLFLHHASPAFSREY